MFCKACGNELKDDSTFCSNCGTQVGAVTKSTQENTLKEDGVERLEIKPVYNWGYQILLSIWNTIITTIVIFFFIVVDSENGMTYAPALFIFIGVITFIIYFIKLILNKFQYKNISYRFYKTKVAYVDGFLNKEEKEVKYKHIREVTMTQNILERIFGLGKIRLYTNASSGVSDVGMNGHNQTGRNGIIIHCVTEVESKLKEIKGLIDAVDAD